MPEVVVHRTILYTVPVTASPGRILKEITQLRGDLNLCGNGIGGWLAREPVPCRIPHPRRLIGSGRSKRIDPQGRATVVGYRHDELAIGTGAPRVLSRDCHDFTSCGYLTMRGEMALRFSSQDGYGVAAALGDRNIHGVFFRELAHRNEVWADRNGTHFNFREKGSREHAFAGVFERLITLRCKGVKIRLVKGKRTTPLYGIARDQIVETVAVKVRGLAIERGALAARHMLDTR